MAGLPRMKILYYTSSGLELKVLREAYAIAKRIRPFELIVRTAAEICNEEKEKELARLGQKARAIVLLPHGGEKSLPGLFPLLEKASSTCIIHVQPVGGSDEDLALAQKFARPKDEGFERRLTYLRYGGPENLKNFLLSLLSDYTGEKFPIPGPKPLPSEGIYHPEGELFKDPASYLAWQKERLGKKEPVVGIWFYQGYWVNQDLAHVNALIQALERGGAIPLAVFQRRFVEPDEPALGPVEVAEHFFMKDGKPFIKVLINLQPFSHSLLWPETKKIYPSLDVAVLQGLTSFSSRRLWEENPGGLSALELAISIAQPEFDGALITLLVATREEGKPDPLLGIPLKAYVPLAERVEKLARMAINWARLKLTPPHRRRVAIIFHHYPPRADRLGCAFGLDSFASVSKLLSVMKEKGYKIDKLYPSGEELAQELLSRARFESRYSSPRSLAGKASIVIPEQKIKAWHRELPAETRAKLESHWGKCPGEIWVDDGRLLWGGILNGNIFLTIQPPRGAHEKIEAAKSIHDPHLPPPHHYLAVYRWLRDEFKAHAIVHVGKHGTLEWLPGKAVALSEKCFPDLVIADLPHIYLYIVNDPGEGTQAKRRSYCAIIDHMIPPQMLAGRYGKLEALAQKLEEYRLLKAENPAQAQDLLEEIIKKALEAHLHEDLSLSEGEIGQDPERFLSLLHEYLEEIAHTYVNDGLHVLGEVPRGKQLTSTVKAISRGAALPEEEVFPILKGIEKEISFCLKALEGGFVPAGPSGAPTRGEIDVLPTGRNFYSVDPQKIPSPLAWQRGVRQAEALLSRHLKDQGRYPRTITMIIWGSPTMRTRGEDFSCALYLLGVRPRWHPKNRRVLGIESIPLEELGRPRIDVTLRTSGFFRDAFKNLMELFDEAVCLVALLEESPEENFLRAAVLKECEILKKKGLSPQEAFRQASFRVFSDPPGAYGTGIGEILDTGHWQKKEDLAEIYLRFGAYAYGKDHYGRNVPEAFRKRLSQTEVTYKNEDTREIDIFSCDCFNAYHGGLNAAVEVFAGRKPVSYSASANDPDQPLVRTTEEEVRFLFRTKVLNPRWIEGMKRHGYKGAGDLSRLVDYCFQWDATSGVLADWMYEEMARTYALSREIQAFFLKHNPRALLNIVERLLEAVQRGLWKNPGPELQKRLEELFLEIEGMVE